MHRPAEHSVGRRLIIRAVAACALAVLACNTREPQRNGESAPPESLAALGTELNLRFPPSTRLIGVRRENGMDDIVQVKLEMAREDVALLVEQTHIDPASFYPGTGGLMGPDQEFWDPHQAPALRTGQADRPGGRALNLGIDDSRPGAAVVYVVEHGT